MISPLLFLLSYFVVGSHMTGNSFVWSSGTGRQFTYHDRGFPFDPWMYRPIARFEYWIRGPRTQIVIKQNFRGGQPIYGYGPFE